MRVICKLCDQPAALLCQWEVGSDGKKIGDEVCRHPLCQQHAGELWEQLSPFAKESFAMDEIRERAA